jgi:2-polyprenyl-3-methyl-5-hydroxy-6-metoxy-1,4-benzoquinol methylase
MDTTVVSEKMATDWAASYVISAQTGEELVYPSETLIRLFKGDYVTGKRIDVKGKSVLDVGFGEGNNSIFLASLGMQVAGVEIHQSICDQVTAKMKKMGLSADLQVGANQSLPFADNTFDFLVSWNVLHYEGTEENIKASISEYSRVLKPGGRLFLSTTGPTHKFLLNANTLGNHQYQIGRPDDFRQGQVHFFFDAPNYIEFYFSPCFKNLQIGRIEDMLFREKLDWWLVTGLKQ